MLLVGERAIRGGVNAIGSLRHFRSNNKYMENFETSQSSVFGSFFDFTSLYAGTMQMPLPCGNYKWRNDLTIVEILNADYPGSVGYFVEVDLEYPRHLYDHHNNLPLAPEKLRILSEWLSDYVKYFGFPASRVAKLVGNLFKKYFHVCHVRNLKFYVEKDLTVKRLQRVLQFDQNCCWEKFYLRKHCLAKTSPNRLRQNFFELL